MIQVLLIATFVALFLRETLERGPLAGHVEPAVVGALYLGAMLALAGASHLIVWRQGRRIDRTGSRTALRIADGAVLGTRIAAVAVHLFAVLALGWLDAVRAALGDLVILDELAAVIPVLGVFVQGWWSMYPIDRRLRDAAAMSDLDEGRPVHPMPGRWAYVHNALRHQAALVVVPVVLIIGWTETVGRGVELMRAQAWFPVFVVQLVGMALVLTMMPVVLRRVWNTVTLGPGPLRETLVDMCRRQGVRVRELLVWGTNGTMINGAVMGFMGPFRYILLTDALLESLPQSQVEAVMAHELGHVKRRHMIWLGVSAISAITLTRAGLEVGAHVAAGGPWLGTDFAQAALALGSLGMGMLIFGFVSRRFEWQADAFAVQHLSGAAGGASPVTLSPQAVVAMSGALESVARLNRIPRHKFTWRHGSIAGRQRRLAALVGQRADSVPVDRQVRWLKVAAGVAMLGASAVIGMSAWTSGPGPSESAHAVRENARDR